MTSPYWLAFATNGVVRIGRRYAPSLLRQQDKEARLPLENSKQNSQEPLGNVLLLF
jgi:hypothetical protein